jgi:ArsR family transcriptional regulator
MAYIYAITITDSMVKSKTDLFDRQLQECAGLFKALSHPARIAILKYLANTKTCITGDISDELPLSRSTVNQHLAELKQAGLIRGSIEGVNTKYCLDPETILEFKRITTGFFRELEISEGCKC